MYIQCLETYPVVSERGKKIHVPRSVAEVAIYRGEAKLAPRPNYGTPEWMAERAAADAARAPNPLDADGNVKGVEWGVRDRDLSPFSKVLVIKRVGCETWFYSEPPADCPPSIVQQFHVSAGTDQDAARVAYEAAKAAQLVQQRAERQGTRTVIYKG